MSLQATALVPAALARSRTFRRHDRWTTEQLLTHQTRGQAVLRDWVVSAPVTTRRIVPFDGGVLFRLEGLRSTSPGRQRPTRRSRARGVARVELAEGAEVGARSALGRYPCTAQFLWIFTVTFIPGTRVRVGWPAIAIFTGITWVNR